MLQTKCFMDQVKCPSVPDDTSVENQFSKAVSIRPAGAGRLIYLLFVRQCEYIYHQYTVALGLRIFKDFVFNYIVEKN